MYEPATLISKKVDCPYCGPLLQPFCHVSALTLQKGCNNSRYVYFIRLHKRTRFVRHRKRVVFVAIGEECILDIVPEETELGNSGVLSGVWGVQNPPKFRRPYKICQTQADLWKLLKIALFWTPTNQDVRKKSSKIVKRPRFANVLH